MPPPTGPEDRLDNLPTPATPLIGRTRELAEVIDLLERVDVRLVNLTGPGGTGKTRLALAAAGRVTGVFGSGVWLTNLSPLHDPALVVPAIAQTFEIKERAGEALLATVSRELRDASVLLVLDNFEQVAPAAPDIAALLEASTRLKVLVTSRTALRVYGEHQYQVAPLAQTEAATLFVQRARAAESGFQPSASDLAAIEAICSRLDGLPLAIELAAARSRVLPPAALLTRVSHRLDFLTGGAQNVPERQQTLRKTLDWSYDLLEEREQALFRRLSVFAGGFGLDDAALVSSTSLDVVDGLASLVDKSLLVRRDALLDGQPRFVMLETIREYAADRLDRSGEADRMRELHARVILELVEQAEPELRGPRQAQWLARLDHEGENMRAALGWTARDGPCELCARITAAVWRYWLIRGYLTEAQQWVDLALARPLDDVPLAARARLLNAAGNVARTRGEFAQARERHEQSLALRLQVGDRAGVGASLSNLGNLALDLGDFERAGELYQRSLSEYRALGDATGAALALNNVGIVLREQSRFDEAAAALNESLELRRQLRDEHGVAQVLDNLGRLALESGDRTRALALLQESLTAARALGDRLSIPLTLEDLASLLVLEGDPPLAVRLWSAADRLRDQLGVPRPPHRRERHGAALAAARAAVGEEQFAALSVAGGALAADDIIGLALAIQPRQRRRLGDDAVRRLLSPREREVAALIARGKSSKEIAAELVISERTADAHADHIRIKLDLHSRAEIALWAAQHGLGSSDAGR